MAQKPTVSFLSKEYRGRKARVLEQFGTTLKVQFLNGIVKTVDESEVIVTHVPGTPRKRDKKQIFIIN